MGCISICRPQCVLFPSAGLIGLYFHLQASLCCISVYTCLIWGVFPSADLIVLYFYLQASLGVFPSADLMGLYFPLQTSLGCISIYTYLIGVYFHLQTSFSCSSIFIQFPVFYFLGYASELSSLPMNSRNRVALKTYHQLLRFVGNPVSITFEECRQNSATKTLNPFHTHCRRTVSPSEHIPQRRGPRLVQVVRT